MSEIQPEIVSVYMHGAGRPDLRPSETMAFKTYGLWGIRVVPFEHSWESSETLNSLKTRGVDQVAGLLAGLSEEDIVVVQGSNEGGSLAVVIANELIRETGDDKRIHVASHSGRLSMGTYMRKDKLNMINLAALGTDQVKRSLNESVSASHNAIAGFSSEQTARMLVTRPCFAGKVPISTMTIPGARTVTIPALRRSHGAGIGMFIAPPYFKAMARHHRRSLAA